MAETLFASFLMLQLVSCLVIEYTDAPPTDGHPVLMYMHGMCHLCSICYTDSGLGATDGTLAPCYQEYSWSCNIPVAILVMICKDSFQQTESWEES